MGRATAHVFADEGPFVAVTDVTLDGSAAVAEEILEAGGKAAAWSLDVRDDERVRGVVENIVANHGPIDILVNNAGVSLGAPIDYENYDDVWAMTLEVNLHAYTRLIRACLPHLMRNGEGRIINIASTEGIGATAGISPYTASKHGVIGLTRGLAVELGAKGVTVNCVCPGPINTGMTSVIPDEAKTKFARRRVPLKRYGDPEEVAHATVSLALPASSYINGAVLVVDGGMTAQNT